MPARTKITRIAVKYSRGDNVHIVHLIGSLGRGGAELFLLRLARGIARAEPAWRQSVWTIGARGAIADEVEAAGIPVRAFHVGRSIHAPLRLWQLVRALVTSDASLVQTWMYHADAVGIAAHYAGLAAPQVWTLRQSNLAPAYNKRETLAVVRACAAASARVPAAIVAGSTAALDAHVAVGYRSARMPVVHNGVDVQRFAPNLEARRRIRTHWGIDDDTVVFGYLARVSPVKAQENLIAACGRLVARRDLPPWRVVLVGDGATPDHPVIAAALAASGAGSHVLAAGPFARPEEVLPAFDVAVSSSLGEGFPNGIAEAMACGLAVVATAVGDTRELVGDTGWLVPVEPAGKRIEALAAALTEVLEAPPSRRTAAGLAARTRATQRFSETAAVQRWIDLYRELADASTT